MAENQAYAASQISESSLGSYKNLTSIGEEKNSSEITQLRDTLKYVCAKLEELCRDNFTLKDKVTENEKQISELLNRVESQEITINQLEQKINDAELSVEDIRLRSPNQPKSPRSWNDLFFDEATAQEPNNKNLLRQHSLKLEVKKETMGAIGGAGHYFGDDKDLVNRGRRDAMSDKQIEKILEIMSLGQTEVNFKTIWNKNYDVTAFGYTFKLKSYWEGVDGDCEFFHLWIKHQVMPIRFKVVAEQIHDATGRVYDKQELDSFVEGKCHKVTLKEKRGTFVRWNVTLLPLYETAK